MVDDAENAINVVSSAGAVICQARAKGSYAVRSVLYTHTHMFVPPCN